jgi:large subunit ribosomal protein L15
VSVSGTNKYNIVRLSVLQRLDDGATVDVDAIKALGYGLKSGLKAGLKVLADDVKLTKKLHVKVQAISAPARAQIEAAGGTVELV